MNRVGAAAIRKFGCGGGIGGDGVVTTTAGAESTIGGTPMSSLLRCRFITGDVEVDDGEHREKAPQEEEDDEEEEEEEDDDEG